MLINKFLISDTMHVDYLRKTVNPFTCPICGKSYAWKVSLSRHLREECGKLPQNICFCGKRFKQKSSFKRHIFTLHKKIWICSSTSFSYQHMMCSNCCLHNGRKIYTYIYMYRILFRIIYIYYIYICMYTRIGAQTILATIEDDSGRRLTSLKINDHYKWNFSIFYTNIIISLRVSIF